jgi:RNA polymerase sigma-70 factor (ECF subfamily)
VIDSLFITWRPRLLRFCAQWLRHPQDAEEVVQDVFTKLCQRGDQLDLTTAPELLLFRLARHRCIDVLRKRRTEPPPEVEPPAPGHDPHLELHEALATLPEGEREVVLLTAIDGLGYRDVAAILGCSVGTVAARRYAAMTKLRTRLTR